MQNDIDYQKMPIDGIEPNEELEMKVYYERGEKPSIFSY